MALVVAHRGASAAVPPGNTVEAFAEAVAQGADWVELDVHLTADGEVIVHHDPVLADGRVIGELAVAELPDFIPMLRDVLHSCSPLGVNVEIKPDGLMSLRALLIESVVELLVSFDGEREFLVTSFDHDIVDEVRALAPTLPTGLLNADGGSLEADLERAARDGHAAINPWQGLVDQKFVDRAHALGVAVNVWTVDGEQQIRTLSEAGVDAIITNVPRFCREVLSAQ
ncbi:MAG: glycerophosphodiester phosphodiesterase [Actinobacteria bacterium]|nr:glycerophosphodiester phosphodiesterase [Actinomycetota bacterium]